LRALEDVTIRFEIPAHHSLRQRMPLKIFAIFEWLDLYGARPDSYHSKNIDDIRVIDVAISNAY